MNIISCYNLLLILIPWIIHFSEQIKHVNELSSIDVCKGKDVDLIFKVEKDENKISKLEWYFKNKIICTSSPLGNFTVKPPYQGRIQRINKTEIRLKSVSIDDEGIYILFPLIAWSTSQNMQKIVLRVLEPPTTKCTCNIIGHPLDLTSEQTETYCGRSQVWKRKQSSGEGDNILNSTLQDKEVHCCQDGEAMKCIDDSRLFCTNVSLPHEDNERPSEDGNTQHTDSVTMPGTDTGSTNTHHMQPFDMQPFFVTILTLCILTLVLLILVSLKKKFKTKKKNKDVEKNVPMMEMNCELREAVNALIKDEKNVRMIFWNCKMDESVMMKEQNVPMTEMNSELREAVNSLIKDEEILHMTGLDSKLHEPVIKDEDFAFPAEPRLETKEPITVHQPMNDSETNSELQSLQRSTLYPRLETASMLDEHQYSPSLETMEEMQELHQAALCKICFIKEISVVFIPCSHSVTCASCSIPVKQCPVCRVLIKMKMNICSN